MYHLFLLPFSLARAPAGRCVRYPESLFHAAIAPSQPTRRHCRRRRVPILRVAGRQAAPHVSALSRESPTRRGRLVSSAAGLPLQAPAPGGPRVTTRCRHLLVVTVAETSVCAL
uniref:Putative secreted protein n=1 Tax=Ixodes ricinus TaxID=34613 RepID=A0A6B0UKE9_IXORI